jgi:hypothetical protein
MADAHSVITALAGIEPDPSGRISTDQGASIATLFDGDIELFIELDERPGAYEHIAPVDDWHYKLRQARNNCPDFLKALSGG